MDVEITFESFKTLNEKVYIGKMQAMYNLSECIRKN